MKPKLHDSEIEDDGSESAEEVFARGVTLGWRVAREEHRKRGLLPIVGCSVLIGMISGGSFVAWLLGGIFA